jgi:hypothetical protein
MSLFHPAEVRRSRLAIDAGGRLSLVRAVLVIAALLGSADRAHSGSARDALAVGRAW